MADIKAFGTRKVEVSMVGSPFGTDSGSPR